MRWVGYVSRKQYYCYRGEEFEIIPVVNTRSEYFALLGSLPLSRTFGIIHPATCAPQLLRASDDRDRK